ncbi:DUF927 domain-containing protein [Mediterraneibacter sp. ICN-202921]|uniref:DUF927 domain-containing protein n=1 Tax=Mediterraneibacter sp. ICN-202921 TaxID=3134657 RepID=UPI0030BFC009
MVKAFEKTEKEMQKKQQLNQTLIENWTNFTGKYDSMKCGSWLAADNGIRTFNKDYSNEVVVCYHPILPIGRLRNLETGEEQIRLAYKRNHRWTEITVHKDIISSASKIVTLSKLGVAVTSENAKLMVKYLSDVENLNDDDIPVRRSSSKLGWIGEGFLPYDTDVIFDGDGAFGQVYESIRERGSWQEWLDHVRELRRSGRPEIKFSLAASFASILVSRLGALPFIVDLWGETEGGKSVSMMLAASVWANPDGGQYIGDFKTTDTQLEIRADLLNHLPMMLDDTSKTSSRIRDNFEGVVYDLCSGKGKSRSNKELGIRRENRWKNTILTNGERPLSSYVSQGGAINRILEIECGEKVFQDPQSTAELLKKNYGFAGKRFVQIIKKMDIDELRNMQQDIQRQIFSIDKMQKQSISMSILLLADRIATGHIFYDEEYISVEEAERVLVDRNEVSEHERCYHYLLDKINMNRQRFDVTATTEQWGLISEGYAVMYPQAVKELCRQGDYSYKAFMNWADRQGVILTDGKNQTKLKKINGKPVRCVFLRLNEFQDKDGFEPAEVTQEELPFK